MATESSSSMDATLSTQWSNNSINAQPEAEIALDLAKRAFNANKYFKAELLCVRALRMYSSGEGRELLRRIYDHIPSPYRMEEGKNWIQDVNGNTPPNLSSNAHNDNSSSRTDSINSSSSAPANAAEQSNSTSMNGSPSSPSVSTSLPSFSLPSWCYIPKSQRIPLLILWCAVFMLAVVRFSAKATSKGPHSSAASSNSSSPVYYHIYRFHYVLNQALFPLLFISYWIWKQSSQRTTIHSNN